MKRTQVSTNAGAVTIFASLLNIFQNVKVENIPGVVENLTCGEIASMILPILAGAWAMWHDEKKVN